MVKEWKTQKVKELVAKIKGYPVIGIVDFHSLPAKQLQVMKKKLKQSGVVLEMTRKRILQRVVESSDKKNIKSLVEYMGTMPALIISNIDPFRLAKIINDNKSPAPAKPGQKSPKNITVPAGLTSFTPGPIIGELGALGVKTKVEGGKLAIIQDAVIIKKDQEISEEAAGILKRLGIEPMEIGLSIIHVWENGIIFTAEQLQINEKAFVEKLKQAHGAAIALSINASIPVKETIAALLQKMHSQALALSLNTGIITDQTREDIVRKAESQAFSLARKVQEKDKNALSPELNEKIIETILGG